MIASIIAIMLVSVGCILDGNGGNGDTVIDITAIPGVTAPAGGATPVATITETDQYTGTVSWDPADNPFNYETVYTATITLTAKSGYTLTGITADFFTVAGAETVTNDADSGVVTAVFPATGSTAPAVIDIAAIPGVTAPAGGATPVTTITETDQYTGTVNWDPADNPFDYETVYTATITLTAKSGYTLTGVTADFFTVAGADTISNDADSGVVTAVFPATGSTPPAVIDIAAIPGVTAPVQGSTPVTTITETDQYTGTVSWDPADNPFDYSTEYTATITLTAKSGYTLTGITENFFTVAGAETVTNDADSGVVTAFFPETDAQVFAIGDTGPSGVGIVFYITDGGLHGLEVAPEDQSTSAAWSTITDAYANGSTAIGTGSANTDAIILQNSGAASAAKICRDYRASEEGDWFLPSMDELDAIWDNLVDDGTGANSGVGGFATDYYWSSSDFDFMSTLAYYQFFFNGNQSAKDKYLSCRVRAVRAF